MWCPDQLWSRVNPTALLRLRSFLTENYPACNAPTFSGRKNDSFPTQLLLSLHWLLWNVSLQMLPSAGPSFSSIELQTLVDANEVEEPLCWELWKWRHKWKQMIFKKYEYPQHVPAGHMSWRGFSIPYLKYLFTPVDGYMDSWEESRFFHWNYTFGKLKLRERSLIHQVLQCVCKDEYFDVCSNSFSLFYKHFGRENWGAVCPLQARDCVLKDPSNAAGTRGT